MTTQKPILAFDTALNGCVVCVFNPVTGSSSVRDLRTDREQAAKLIPLIQETMAESGVTFADLGLIVTSVGPGSFTGLRISLSTARSFALALNIPVQGVGTLEAMAATCHTENDTTNSLVLIETKRSDFYVQMFDPSLKALTEPACASAETILESYDVKGPILCGDAVQRFQDETKVSAADVRERFLLDPLTLAKRGLALYGTGENYVKPQPVYIRGADVSVSNKIQRQIQDMPL